MLLLATVFSLIAASLILLTGRKDPSRAHRLTATSISLLLLFPLLSFLPKLRILPSIATQPAEVTGHIHLFTWIWMTGGFVLGLRLLRSARLIHRWKAQSQFLRTESTNSGRRVELRELAAIDGPIASGCFRPVIFLPACWTAWSPQQRQAVLTHELAHHHRRDPLWRLLAAIACTVHWFNPLVWWLARRHAFQSEFACDAMVIESGVAPDSYAHLLCDLASDSKPTRLAPSISDPTSLGARVARLMSRPQPIPSWLQTTLLALTILAALLLATLRQSAPAAAPVPMPEVTVRLSANPFPGNP